MKATHARKRAWKAGATAGFTMIASAVMLASPSVTAAHADTVGVTIDGSMCYDVTVWSTATGTLTTNPFCVTNEGLPFDCTHQALNLTQGGFAVDACVFG